MKHLKLYTGFILLVLIVFFSLSCASTKGGYPYIGNDYGVPVSYGEGKHPGIDYDISRGTPLIACADGTIS